MRGRVLAREGATAFAGLAAEEPVVTEPLVTAGLAGTGGWGCAAVVGRRCCCWVRGPATEDPQPQAWSAASRSASPMALAALLALRRGDTTGL